MADEARMPNLMDPMELWKQWYETSSKVWSNVLDSSKETSMDPYGLSRLWMKNIGEAQEQLKAGSSGMIDPIEVWKQWFDATTDAWKRASEWGKASVEFSNQWLKILNETRAKMVSGEIGSTDPVTFVKQWYDATSDTLSQAVGDTISSEQFLEAQRQFIETFTSAVSVSNRVNEQYFKNLQLPTRSDIARVAELVISLEDKVDKIEDAFENFEYGYSNMATSELVEGLATQLGQVESKLNTLDTLPAVLKRTEAIGGLAARLEQVEGKLGPLDALPAVLERTGAIESLAGRLDGVESKLDTLLNVLKKIQAKEASETAKSDGAARRKAPKKKEVS